MASGVHFALGPVDNFGAATTAVLCRVTNKSFQLSNFVSHSSHSAGSQALGKLLPKSNLKQILLPKFRAHGKWFKYRKKLHLARALAGACWCLVPQLAGPTEVHKSPRVPFRRGQTEIKEEREEERH